MFKKWAGWIVLGSLVCASAAFAEPRLYRNKLITGVQISETQVQISFTLGQTCASPDVIDGCSRTIQDALIAEGPNKAFLTQLFINAFANKIPLDIMIDEPNGIVTITGARTISNP